jgi:hypothetical protein
MTSWIDLVAGLVLMAAGAWLILCRKPLSRHYTRFLRLDGTPFGDHLEGGNELSGVIVGAACILLGALVAGRQILIWLFRG